MATLKGVFVLGLLCAMVITVAVSSTSPGVTVTLSQKGLRTAATVAIDQLVADIHGKTIPEQKGHHHHIKCEIKDVTITSFTRPTSSLVVNPNQGITWSMAGAGASVHGHFNARKHAVHTHGSFDVKVSGVSMTVSIGMGMDKNGRPTIAMKSCSCHVGHLSIKFHHGASWILNLLRHFLENPIKDKLKSMMCDSVKKAINVQAAKSLAIMKVQVPVGKFFTLDYRLVAPPVFATQAVEAEFKGQFMWAKSPSEAPFKPQPMKAPPTQKMVLACLSDYVGNTMAYASHEHGLLNYTLTKNNLPKNDSGFLNTTCTGVKCIGILLPQIGKMYPHSSVEMAIHTTSPPSMKTTNKVITGTVQCQIDFNARLQNGTLRHAFTTELKATVPMTASMRLNNVTIHFESFAFTILNTTSDVGPIPSFVQGLLFNMAAEKVLMMLNAMGSTGFELPGIKHAAFVDPQLSMLEGFSCFATDVKYSPATLMFQPHNKADESEPRPTNYGSKLMHL